MVYVLVVYPDLEDDSKIQGLRKKYSPYYSVIKPHITLVFPFPDMDREEIENHVSKILKNFTQFDLRLVGLVRSFDNWLFLGIEEGNDKIVELHDQLYTGILREHLRKDIEFIPHVGLGLFKTDEEYQKAENEARKLNLDYKCKVESIYLLHLRDEKSEIDWSKQFILRKDS